MKNKRHLIATDVSVLSKRDNTMVGPFPFTQRNGFLFKLNIEMISSGDFSEFKDNDIHKLNNLVIEKLLSLKLEI